MTYCIVGRSRPINWADLWHFDVIGIEPMPALKKLLKKINRLNVSASVYKFMSKELLIAVFKCTNTFKYFIY